MIDHTWHPDCCDASEGEHPSYRELMNANLHLLPPSERLPVTDDPLLDGTEEIVVEFGPADVAEMPIGQAIRIMDEVVPNWREMEVADLRLKIAEEIDTILDLINGLNELDRREETA